MATAIDITGTGFTVLDRLYAGNDSTEALGGSCGNVLVSLAMLDHSVAPVLEFGCDSVGDFLVAAFAKAGADTRYIARSPNISSPVLAQLLDVETGQHSFSFHCPVTHQELPRYVGIGDDHLRRSREVIHGCGLFYTDRLSLPILQAMEAAATGGAIVYFEPSSITNVELFRRALAVTDILKFSIDRLGSWDDLDLPSSMVAIVTHGAAGLQIRNGSFEQWCAAVPAAVVRDTCGSGDMVSVGVIDRLLADKSPNRGVHYLNNILAGVIAGQRLAAANCAFAGARGLFERYGAEYARDVLAGSGFTMFDQFDLFD